MAISIRTGLVQGGGVCFFQYTFHTRIRNPRGIMLEGTLRLSCAVWADQRLIVALTLWH